MRKPLYLLLILACLTSCGTPDKPAKAPDPEMETENWIPLFNGKDLTGWDIKIAGKEVNDNARNTFVWEDDILRIKAGTITLIYSIYLLHSQQKP